MQENSRKKTIILVILVMVMVILSVVVIRRSFGTGGGNVTVEDATEVPTPPIDNPQDIPYPDYPNE